MRIPVIAPKDLSPEQKPFYDKIRNGITRYISGFTTERSDGGLIGPFNTWLHFQDLGEPIFDLFAATNTNPQLPLKAREVVILLTGAKLNCLFELYSHEAVAQEKGLTPLQIAILAAGGHPGDLDQDEELAFVIAEALIRGATLANTTYQAGVDRWGEHAVAEIGCLIGVYTAVSNLLNIFDVALPQTEGA